MKILIICSKRFYPNIENIKSRLEQQNHIVNLPNCYDNPNAENEVRNLSKEAHAKFKARMFKQSDETIKKMDAVLVLNYDKDDNKNYVGGATFLEMYDAFRAGKKIYMLNDIPNNILKDEIIGFSPIVINGDLNKIN